MRNIKARYLWIGVGVGFLVAVGLIIGVTFTSGVWTKICIGLIAAVFIFMTITIQMASVKSFRYKAKPKKYPKMIYSASKEDFDFLLKKNGYKPRVAPYGMSYLKIDGTNAYKVVLIRNCEKYFAPEKEQDTASPNHALEKCKKFIGCELFLEYDEEALKKLPDFNFAGEKIYYFSLYKENDQYICPNYIEPSEEFQELFQKIKFDLTLEEYTQPEEEDIFPKESEEL